PATQQYLLGITYGYPKVRFSLSHSFSAGGELCVRSGRMIFDSLVAMFTKGEGLDQVAGPVGAISMISQQTKTYGFEGFLSLLILISINLGIFNLLPIPGLDGSRILFLLVEKGCNLFGVSLNRKFETAVYLVGFVLLIGAAVFFTYRDVLRLIS
ncbi:MAG: RIP metalloprotease RseP, partial [Clostridiales bacterium]|nr:RIP metalloprotease RseP [Clostridiales bacterium]